MYFRHWFLVSQGKRGSPVFCRITDSGQSFADLSYDRDESVDVTVVLAVVHKACPDDREPPNFRSCDQHATILLQGRDDGLIQVVHTLGVP